LEEQNEDAITTHRHGEQTLKWVLYAKGFRGNGFKTFLVKHFGVLLCFPKRISNTDIHG